MRLYVHSLSVWPRINICKQLQAKAKGSNPIQRQNWKYYVNICNGIKKAHKTLNQTTRKDKYIGRHKANR